MKPNPMGATFAERAAAARGDEDFEAPDTSAPRAPGNSTFASRAGLEPDPEPADGDKSVEAEDSENKAVQSASTKSGRGGRRS